MGIRYTNTLQLAKIQAGGMIIKGHQGVKIHKLRKNNAGYRYSITHRKSR